MPCLSVAAPEAPLGRRRGGSGTSPDRPQPRSTARFGNPAMPGTFTTQPQLPLHPLSRQVADCPSISTRHPPAPLHSHVKLACAELPRMSAMPVPVRLK